MTAPPPALSPGGGRGRGRGRRRGRGFPGSNFPFTPTLSPRGRGSVLPFPRQGEGLGLVQSAAPFGAQSAAPFAVQSAAPFGVWPLSC